MRKGIILTLLLIAGPAAGDLPAGKWSVARPMALPPLTAPGLVYLPLDEEALTAQSISEYRVVEGGKTEVPYREVVENGEKLSEQVEHKTVDWSEKSDRAGKLSTTITLDLGPHAPPVSLVSLDLAGADYSASVRVEQAASAGGTGALVTTDKVYRRGADFAKDSVVFRPTKQRYLRLTIGRDQGKLPQVGRIETWQEVEIPLTLVPVPATLTRKEDHKHRLTILSLDPGKLTRDGYRTSFEVADPRFSRGITVEVATESPQPGERPVYDAMSWVRLERSSLEAQVRVDLSFLSMRYLRMSIENGDDRPLSISSVTLFRTRRGLVFAAEPRGKYELWYGRSDAPRPEYDLAKLPLVAPPTELPMAGLGAPTRLATAPPPPPPWSETHPAVFWGVLMAVVVLLVLIIVSAMRRAKPVGGAETTGEGRPAAGG